MIPEILVWWKRFIGLGRSAYPAFLDTMASNFFCKTASTGEDDDDSIDYSAVEYHLYKEYLYP